jgi:hypothetical protein
MAEDTLSRFITGRLRSKPAPEPAAKPASPPSLVVNHDRREAYEPFDVKDRVEGGLAIRRRKGALSHAIMYNYIHSVAFDDDSWSSIHITVSGMAIEIHGRNLRPIAEAIRLRCCDFVQEYRADRFILPEPVDDNAPFIESISVEVLHAIGAPKGE